MLSHLITVFQPIVALDNSVHLTMKITGPACFRIDSSTGCADIPVPLDVPISIAVDHKTERAKVDDKLSRPAPFVMCNFSSGNA